MKKITNNYKFKKLSIFNYQFSINEVFNFPLKIIMLLFLTTSSYSQTFKWGKKGGSTSTENLVREEVYSMAVDNQNNIYSLALVLKNNLNIDGNPKQFFGPSGVDVALSSFACDGTYRWSKIIGGGVILKIYLM